MFVSFTVKKGISIQKGQTGIHIKQVKVCLRCHERIKERKGKKKRTQKKNT